MSDARIRVGTARPLEGQPEHKNSVKVVGTTIIARAWDCMLKEPQPATPIPGTTK